MNWIVGLLSGWEALHKMHFRIAALSGDVRSSYTLDVILSLPVPDPNFLLWISKAGMTNSCVILLSEEVSLVNCFVSSSSKSNQKRFHRFFVSMPFLELVLN